MAKPEELGAILRRQLKSLGIQKKLKEVSVAEVWPEIVGEAVAAHTDVIRCADGKLLVKVDNPVWRHELMYQKSSFLRLLNGRMGEHIVDDIHFTGP
jgi:predicted nucleic acid-binding Zn ribbon protein